MIKELVHDEMLLSRPCAAATAQDADVAQDLLDTLVSIDSAACLAANQIGAKKQSSPISTKKRIRKSCTTRSFC